MCSNSLNSRSHHRRYSHITSCLPHIRCHRPLLLIHVWTSRVLVSPLGLDTPSKAGEERGLADQVDTETCSWLHNETHTNSNRLIMVSWYAGWERCAFFWWGECSLSGWQRRSSTWHRPRGERIDSDSTARHLRTSCYVHILGIPIRDECLWCYV